MDSKVWQLQGDKLALQVWVQPGARETGIAGLHDGYLKIRLHAPPVDGKANEALIRFVASLFGVNPTAVSISKGITSRRKKLVVDNPATFPAALIALTGNDLLAQAPDSK